MGKEKSLEDQLKEHKEKEKKLLLRIEEDKRAKELEEKLAKEKRELDEQIVKEQEFLENEKKLKEKLDREIQIVKNKEIELQNKEKALAVRKEKEEKLKDHPDGCFCQECKALRVGDDLPYNLYQDTPTSIVETGYLEPKKSKFNIKLPKRTPKPEILTKEDLGKYHKVKKDPNALLLFIKNQRNKIQKHAEIETAKNVIKKEGAIDTRVQPSIFTDITVLGVRLAIGFSFIAHGLSKMDGDLQMFTGMLQAWGVPTELAFPIALLELLAGIFITLGFLTRVSSAFIGIIMLGAIFVVKGTGSLVGQGGIELDLIILAAVALLGIFGPGRLSIANIGIKGMIFDRKLQ